ncbi:ankyrin [Cryphonectria parasitica EP155]|uniref:Ankyrin n=1 Tax=Cryphonectria parasitica (strain ATCC 38755 / EP155) TaxID=660469 RepID=A0A9P5CQZ5_CRYP1|nr:ankyrin [Cryphonectria parasitica EP155]KAF3766997.1 ankyrin [Cryphonectria parasitica EP155]
MASSPNANDDFHAEEQLKRRRLLASGQRPNGDSEGFMAARGGLLKKTSFSISRKDSSFTPKEIFDELHAHVQNQGSPGVAEALVQRLLLAGGNINNPNTKPKTAFSLKRRSMNDLVQTQSQILQEAVKNGQEDMVAVLVPHADPAIVDAALPLALAKGSLKMTEVLLSHGANLSTTPEGRFQFQQLCINGEQADLVGLLLQSDGRPPPDWISGAMVLAARKGHLATVVRLSRSVADGSYNEAEALKLAVTMCRIDIALAILTGRKPPAREHVNEAFKLLFEYANIMPTEKKCFADVLLLAGAEGDVTAEALVKACETEFYDMIDLLITAGASIDYGHAMAVRNAIQKGNTSLVKVLLGNEAALKPDLAADLIPEIPKRTSPEDRLELLTLLLRKGAGGSQLDDALVDAVEAHDLKCVTLLLTPQFPGSGRLQPSGSHDLKRGPRSMIFEHHATSSVNHKGGLALSIAVRTGQIPIAESILAAKPSLETLAQVFPLISQLEPAQRYRLTESFLKAGVSGPCVHAALQHAIDERPPRRDQRLIGLLLHHDVDVKTKNDGAPILSAIAQGDADLLQVLLNKGRPDTRTATAAFMNAMDARVDINSQVIGESLGRVLQEKPTDLALLSALLKLGKGDVNINTGEPLVFAVRNPDPRVLDLMLKAGKPNAETMDMAVQAMNDVPSTDEKAAKLESILRNIKQKETLNRLLVTEVNAILECPPEKRTLVVLKALLAAGIDVNADKAAALCCAVGQADKVITDVLFAAKPSSASLGEAMRFAMNIPDEADRLAFTARLLDAGAPAAEANRALTYAITACPRDLALIHRLVAKADMRDGEALVTAVRRCHPDLVELMAKSKRHATASLNQAFSAAMKIGDHEIRKSICESLLNTGASGDVVSNALLDAAGTGDLTLIAILLKHGASTGHREGQCVVEACRAGSCDVLKVLLSTRASIDKKTLERGFQAATEVSDLKQRLSVYKVLLDKGVTGEVLDAELVSAARYGYDAVDLVQLLLHFGASPDHNNGEAVYNATCCAFMDILKLMLAISPAGGKQQKPSSRTLVRSLKASSKLSTAPRLQVVQWLFEAGLQISDDVHVALNKVVNEEESSIDLIKLFLEKGASPTALGCKSLVDVAQIQNLEVLDLFLKCEISLKDISWTMKETFIPAAVDVWLSPRGLEVARRLLAKGAEGEGLSVALSASLDYLGTEKDGIARQFVSILIQHNADVNQGHGEPLVRATKTGDTQLVQQMLQQGPNAESLSMAFPYVFDHELKDNEVLDFITLFTHFQDGEIQLDPKFRHPDSAPTIFKAISRYPRSTKIVETLLDAGYFYDEPCSVRVLDEVEEEEQANLLIWCLLQPMKRVSSDVITTLIKRGAAVNIETPLSKTTPLMLAIKEKRKDIVQALVMANAEVDVTDVTGNTPLTLTTQIGGDLGRTMMSSILAAEPSQNDGSLHNAARDLDIRTMQVLVDFGHEVDFPSPLHGGRTALGELCLHSSDAGPLTAAQEKAMEKAMTYLMRQGTDLSLLSDGKSVLYLAMESADAVPTTRALLKVGMWKHINRQWNLYTDGVCTYSPTQYAKRILRQNDTSEQLHTLLKANRGEDIYFANEGPQPEGAIGLPDDIVRAERERKARLERIQLEAEDHTRALSRTQEVADIHLQIFAQRAALEDERARQKQLTELNGVREKAQLEEQLFNEAVRRQRAEQAAALDHQSSLMQVEAERKRLLFETEYEGEQKRQQLLLAFEGQQASARMDTARQMSALQRREREDINAFEKEQDKRLQARMTQERKLIESKNQMAANLAALGMPQRRQIGYVSGELE